MKILIGALVTAAAIAIWMLGKRADAERASRFAERLPMQPTEHWERCYKGEEVSLSSVEKAMRLIGDAICVSPEKLRPSDRFAIELAPLRGWQFDDGLADVFWYVNSKSRGSGTEIHNVDDLIRFVDRWDRDG